MTNQETAGKKILLPSVRSWSTRPSNTGVFFVEIPWLEHLREARKIVKTLAESGWVVLKLASPEAAVNLSRTVDSKIVRAFRLSKTSVRL
jgi:hypothetical protein